MTQEERIDEIRKMLEQANKLSTKQLAEHFGVAFDTARRDVLRLTSTGQAVRVHGGLMALDSTGVPNFGARNKIQSPLKEKMAKIAKKFIHPGEFDFIAPSTTITRMCEMIDSIDLTIATNSIDSAAVLANSPMPEVILLGGKLIKGDHFTSSAEAIKQIQRLHFNTAFIGTSKIRPDGIYTATQEDADIISTVVERANKVVLIAERYKFTNHNSSPYLSAPINKIDVVITDTPLDQKIKINFNDNTQIIPVQRRQENDQSF